MDKYDKIVSVIEKLKEYTVYHFNSEEKYMEKYKLQKIIHTKIDHAEFIKKVNGVDLSKIDENQDEAIMGILTFSNNWLISHILEKGLLIPASK